MGGKNEFRYKFSRLAAADFRFCYYITHDRVARGERKALTKEVRRRKRETLSSHIFLSIHTRHIRNDGGSPYTFFFFLTCGPCDFSNFLVQSRFCFRISITIILLLYWSDNTYYCNGLRPSCKTRPRSELIAKCVRNIFKIQFQRVNLISVNSAVLDQKKARFG